MGESKKWTSQHHGSMVREYYYKNRLLGVQVFEGYFSIEEENPQNYFTFCISPILRRYFRKDARSLTLEQVHAKLDEMVQAIEHPDIG